MYGTSGASLLSWSLVMPSLLYRRCSRETYQKQSMTNITLSRRRLSVVCRIGLPALGGVGLCLFGLYEIRFIATAEMLMRTESHTTNLTGRQGLNRGDEDGVLDLDNDMDLDY